MQTISELRREYTKARLEIDSVEPDPLAQFEKWFSEARKAEIPDPNAMALATVNPNGRPSVRMVLLKGIENGKFVFYTNYHSRKGKDMDNNPVCAILFYWPELERQIRIEGVVARIDADRSTNYYHSRPRGAQLGAWASPQSAVIQNREILDERMIQMEEKFKDKEVIDRPQQWGGYEIEPLQFEFWQGRENRLHDRIVYVLDDNVWKMMRLAP